ncbi:MAG: hypothetical protein ACYDGR_11215 [Candidatus Dormibacteria bacterium]
MGAILTPHPHVRDIRPDDAGGSAIASWLGPLQAELRGVDLSKPVFDEQGDLLGGSRKAYLSSLLAEKVWAFSERLRAIDNNLVGVQRQAALRVVRGEMTWVRAQAVAVARTGIAPGATAPPIGDLEQAV